MAAALQLKLPLELLILVVHFRLVEVRHIERHGRWLVWSLRLGNRPLDHFRLLKGAITFEVKQVAVVFPYLLLRRRLLLILYRSRSFTSWWRAHNKFFRPHDKVSLLRVTMSTSLPIVTLRSSIIASSLVILILISLRHELVTLELDGSGRFLIAYLVRYDFIVSRVRGLVIETRWTAPAILMLDEHIYRVFDGLGRSTVVALFFLNEFDFFPAFTITLSVLFVLFGKLTAILARIDCNIHSFTLHHFFCFVHVARLRISADRIVDHLLVFVHFLAECFRHAVLSPFALFQGTLIPFHKPLSRPVWLWAVVVVIDRAASVVPAVQRWRAILALSSSRAGARWAQAWAAFVWFEIVWSSWSTLWSLILVHLIVVAFHVFRQSNVQLATKENIS